MDVIRCPMCQTENPVGSDFCRLCHAKLPESAPVAPSGEGEVEAVPGQVPDWLSRLRQEVSGETPSTPPPPKPPADDGLGWLGELPRVSGEEEGPPPGAVPEWVGDAPPTTSGGEADVPDWLARIRAKSREDSGPVDEEGLAVLPVPERDVVPAAPLEPEPEKGPPPPAAGPAEPASLGLPDWLMAAQPPAAPDAPPPAEPERPAWLEGMTSDDSRELPRVPALVFTPDDAGAPGAADIDLTSISSQIPDWMTEARPADAPPDRANLAPATLPTWLEAMRPVDTFRSVVEFDSAEDQAVEAAGPLAGLRGVLLAEPVVAMPRAASGEATRLDVNEKQYAQAELLHRLVDDERRETPHRPPPRTRPALLRWVVGAALLVAVGLPAIFGFPTFALPAFVPADLASLIGVMDALPADAQVLMVFDYEAGATGEMEAVAGPLVSHLMQRGAGIATLSTRPGGPALAERLMARVGSTHNYVRGEDFVHLGFLPGGAAAVELFAGAPRQAVPVGYLPDPEAGSVWESPVLEGITALSDFAMMVVITSGSEDTRVWIEQAQPHLGGHPLVTVISAGAEPLVRPYYESTDPRIAGILSGLTSATAYEHRLGQPSMAHARWSSFGLGLLTAEVLLILGVFGGLTRLALRRR